MNIGVREGDIESPPLVNLVYGEIVRLSKLDTLNEDAFVPGNNKVVGIAYADDLALLGQEIYCTQEKFDEMAVYFSKFNMKANGGKTKLLIFVKSRRPRGFNANINDWQIVIDRERIERVSEFKYLGVTLNFLCEVDRHISLCEDKVKVIAVKIGRLCSQLHLTNFQQLRTYFYSFVVSQMYGRQMVSFDSDKYERGLMLFVHTVFQIPVGFPRAIFYVLLDIQEYSFLELISRSRFFRSGVSSPSRFLDRVLTVDRELFAIGSPSWNNDFQIAFENFLPDESFSELDLFDATEPWRELLERESLYQREARLRLMPSAALFMSLVPYGVPRNFLRALSLRSFEEVRLLIWFFGQMLRFCFFNSRQDQCPLCGNQFNSEHFFECDAVDFSNSLPNRSTWRDRCRSEEWKIFFDLFFSVALLWTIATPRVRVGHVNTIQKANTRGDTE